MSNEQDVEHSEIHLPAPSAAPLVVAAGATIAAFGVLSSGLILVGLIVLAIGIGMWAFGPH
ncbi:MAG: hypothetical protein IT326_02830 [Anaerolineae bacterium]|nr:hypothetical protein [Anaerolineae bacterium]